MTFPSYAVSDRYVGLRSRGSLRNPRALRDSVSNGEPAYGRADVALTRGALDHTRPYSFGSGLTTSVEARSLFRYSAASGVRSAAVTPS